MKTLRAFSPLLLAVCASCGGGAVTPDPAAPARSVAVVEGAVVTAAGVPAAGARLEVQFTVRRSDQLWEPITEETRTDHAGFFRVRLHEGVDHPIVVVVTASHEGRRSPQHESDWRLTFTDPPPDTLRIQVAMD